MSKNKIIPGDTFITASGRMTSGFPKYSKCRETKKDRENFDQWLIENAIAEAQARNNDVYNIQRFSRLKPGLMSSADSQDIKIYMFKNVNNFLILNA